MTRRSPVLFTQEEIDEIIRLYTKENKSLTHIGLIYNRQIGAVRRLLLRNNIYTRDLKRAMDIRLQKRWVGKKFHKLTIIERVHGDFKRGGQVRRNCSVWKFLCDCGNTIIAPIVQIERNKHGTGRRSCGCLKLATFTRVGRISGTYLKMLQSGANSRKLLWAVDGLYIWELFLKQNGLCALSGQPLEINIKHINQTASLDRIDSKQGYVPGNVQWVHKDINKMKQNFSDIYLIDIACKIADHYRLTKTSEACLLSPSCNPAGQ